jgi:hypothetical protein
MPKKRRSTRLRRSVTYKEEKDEPKNKDIREVIKNSNNKKKREKKAEKKNSEDEEFNIEDAKNESTGEEMPSLENSQEHHSPEDTPIKRKRKV